jgi:dTDP-4-amino-4,6-dideoxygalactose transaminase
MLPVHLFGRPCAIGSFQDLAEEYGLTLIEDTAQAIGALLAGTEQRAGTRGRFGCFSFYPTKNLGAAGDGGCVVCVDAADARALRSRARHGVDGDPYRHLVAGVASRLDAVQAAVLRVKLPHVDRWNAARRAVAERYDTLLAADSRLDGVVRRPALAPGHVFHHYVVRVRERDQVRSALAADGIQTQVYYPIPLHMQPCFAALGHEPGDYPEADRASRECLALPMRPELSAADAAAVVSGLARVVTTA